MIKTIVMNNNIWEYCDSDKIKETVWLSESANSALINQERLYTIRIINYERIRKSLVKINNTIQRLVCEDYQIYLKDAHTSRERLKSLRTIIKFSLWLMEENVRDKYENLLKKPKRISLDRWLN